MSRSRLSSLARLSGPRSGVGLWLVLVVGLCGAAACGRPHVKGTVAVETVLKAWTAEGFSTDTLVNVEPDDWSAGACSRGTMSGLEILLCEYATDEALAAGEAKITRDWTQQSVPTGATVRSARTLLAIADRDKADPNGRTIARLLKTFRDQR